MKRTISGILMSGFLLSMLSGCLLSKDNSGTEGEPQTVVPALASEQQTEEQEVERKNVNLRVMLPHTKGELAQILDQLATKEGYSLEIVNEDNSLGYADSLKEYVAAEQGAPDLFWVEGEAQVRELREAEIPYTDLLSPQRSVLTRSLAEMLPEEDRIINKDGVYALPIGYYCEGTLVNLSLLADILGTDDLTGLKNNLTQATFAQWIDMVEQLDEFLAKPQKKEITLGSTVYNTLGYRPESAKSLRGIFALGTGESRSYFQNILSAVYGAAFESIDDYENTSLEGRAYRLSDPLIAGLDLLYLETLYMTHETGPYRRGEEFSDVQRLTVEQAEELFAQGTALFVRGTSVSGMQFEREYPELKGKLAIIPTKLPVRVELETGEELKIYQSYATASDGYLCLNSNSEYLDEMEALLLRMFASDQGRDLVTQQLCLLPFTDLYPSNQLTAQLALARAQHQVYQVPATFQLLDSQQKRIGEWVQLELMRQEEWEEEVDSAFLSAALGYIDLPATEIPREDSDAPDEETEENEQEAA